MINYKETGFRIRSRRLELGFTQEFVAEKANISPGYYSQVENGSRKAGINTFMTLSQVLSISLDHILCNRVAELNPDSFDPIDSKIFYHLSRFPERKKNLILGIIELIEKHG